ncbi:hypothetical protein CISIN_1g0096412mg, partial [Citrus sinensis]
KTLKAFREGKIQVLVSSDAMTRGMDVEGVNNVVNYDKPAYIKTYIHRAGRTARAGQLGRCFTLLHKDEVCLVGCLTPLLLCTSDILQRKTRLQKSKSRLRHKNYAL